MNEEQIAKLKAEIQERRKALKAKSKPKELTDKYKEVEDLKPILKDVVG